MKTEEERMKKDKCLVLLSGGQDSTTCLYWAKDRFADVHAIGFDYGQSHAIEIEKAKEIAEEANVPFKIYNLKGLFSSSSLTEGGDHNEVSKIGDNLPASFVAGRNLVFLSIAGSYCADHGIQDIVTGVCQTDYSGYPDCRRSTIDALQLALTLGVSIGDIRIHTPLMYLTKAETWKLAKELGVLKIILEKTMTDYNGSEVVNEWGLGELNNPASILRAKGYLEAKAMGWL